MAHIRQLMSDILQTPVGYRVIRREYGSLIFKLIDRPQNAVHTSSSRYLSENIKKPYKQCQNINCGHTFKTRELFDGSIEKPSLICAVMPDPMSQDQQTLLI